MESDHKHVIIPVMGKKKIDERSTLHKWLNKHWRQILGEFIATTLLIFIGCMTCIPLEGFHKQPPLYSTLGFNFIILCIVQSFSHLSGTHMNPAVTIFFMIWGKISVALGIIYMIIQCTGAICGYGLLIHLIPQEMVPQGMCVTIPNVKLNMIQAVSIEAVLTVLLILFCCAVNDPDSGHLQDSNGIKFAFAITGLSVAGATLTGPSMNPARSLGPAFWSGIWTAHWVYWVGPVAGAVFASVLYKYIWLKHK